ncbi:MAG TPA: MerR family transcriptional regulator [Pseudonocardiaceae bacterium]|nr:MerR family transcriptional regulator [Pseudonocardiaceae bacterium]
MSEQGQERQREWKIGELASATGLTVRTLHHYDQIGLLSSTLRTEGGHRLYTAADATRLYQVVALRGLGLRLDQIKDCLVNGVDPVTVLTEQLRALTVRLKAGERLRIRLAALLDTLAEEPEPTAEDLLAVVAQTTATDRLLTDHLDAEQLERLAARHAELGPVADRLVAVELPGLYRQALAEYDAGTQPTDPVVLGIVEAIDRVSARLSGGDPAASGRMRRLWAEHGEEVQPNWGIPWADLVDYLQQARDHLHVAPDNSGTGPDDGQSAGEESR